MAFWGAGQRFPPASFYIPNNRTKDPPHAMEKFAVPDVLRSDPDCPFLDELEVAIRLALRGEAAFTLFRSRDATRPEARLETDRSKPDPVRSVSASPLSPITFGHLFHHPNRPIRPSLPNATIPHFCLFVPPRSDGTEQPVRT